MASSISRIISTKSAHRVPLALTIQDFDIQHSAIKPMKGVYWCRIRNKWKAQGGSFGRYYNLGRYDNYEDACEAVRKFKENL